MKGNIVQKSKLNAKLKIVNNVMIMEVALSAMLDIILLVEMKVTTVKKFNQNAKSHTVKNVLMAFAQFVKVDTNLFQVNKEVIVPKFNQNV